MIKIVPYDSTWPSQFEAEAVRIREAIGGLALRIEHVGSTSVPGLAAKPVIDIQVSVATLERLALYAEPLARIGYSHIPLGDFDLVYPFFQKPADWPSTHHIHLCVIGAEQERSHLAFRDHLRSHPDVAAEYAELKRKLAAAHDGSTFESRERYSLAKTRFVEVVLERALSSDAPRSPLTFGIRRSLMNSPGSDTVFSGSIPELYDTHLVPLIFEPYATDLANRVAALDPSRVLETAAGTGVVTRAMARALPSLVELVATDLNQPMLDRAAAVGTQRPVQWQQADATRLPFDDASFDVVACQFGVMFFPDKVRAFSEARRVLRRGGAFVFNVWDRIENNEFADIVTTALAGLFPSDPPRFMARTPHGYFDHEVISLDLANAGFSAAPRVETIAARSRALSARMPAIAYCQGTPLRNEIEARSGAAGLAAATSACAAAIAARFGDGAVDGKIQAHIVVVQG